MARVVQFEISANQPEKVIDFYSSIFDWKVEKVPGPTDYWVVKTGDSDQPGIDGGFFRPNEWFSGSVNTIEVDDIDKYVARIRKAGGERVVEKFPIPEKGFIAYCKDVEGTIFGLFQADAKAGQEEA